METVRLQWSSHWCCDLQSLDFSFLLSPDLHTHLHTCSCCLHQLPASTHTDQLRHYQGRLTSCCNVLQGNLQLLAFIWIPHRPNHCHRPDMFPDDTDPDWPGGPTAQTCLQHNILDPAVVFWGLQPSEERWIRFVTSMLGALTQSQLVDVSWMSIITITIIIIITGPKGAPCGFVH